MYNNSGRVEKNENLPHLLFLQVIWSHYTQMVSVQQQYSSFKVTSCKRKKKKLSCHKYPLLKNTTKVKTLTPLLLTVHNKKRYLSNMPELLVYLFRTVFVQIT
jgi:hypothetical protein